MESVYTEELEMLRRTVKMFLDKELEPRVKEFEANGVDRRFWLEAGRAGLLGLPIPEEYGGPGADPLAILVVSEELGRSPGAATGGALLAIDIATHILIGHGNDAQKRHYCPGILSGEVMQAMALTEPDAGSDATAIRTTAIRDGDHYVINGAKTYISNGAKADVLYVVAKTDPTKRGRGMSMIIVDANTPGVTRRRLPTMGYRGGDLGEIFFSDVRVPVSNLLGHEGGGMEILMSTFALDRLQIAARSLTAAEYALEITLEYVKTRKAFGQRIFDFQNTQFKMAEMKTDIAVGRAFYESLIRKYSEGNLKFEEGAMVKLWICEMEGRVMDTCLQLFGGAGYMDEMPISRMFTAARVQRIYAGTSELQKVAIAKAMDK